jgi:predicted acetyltransferase
MTTTATRATLAPRLLTDGDWPEFLAMVSAAFLSDPGADPLGAERSRAVLEPGRTLGVFDDTRLLGGGGILTREMTLPGSGPSPVAAVSHVGVRPDARGRGALTALIRAQLTGLHESGGEPVAVLWASMAPIYGRFGYGPASRRGELCVPARAPFREGSPAGGTVRWLDEADAAESLRAIHRGLAASRVGWVSRPEASWRWWLADPETGRGGSTAYRYALHQPRGGGEPDGYAVFRLKPNWPAAGPDFEVDIHELVAANPAAYAGLWRSLLDLDMVGRVRYGNVALDDPIPQLLVNARALLSDVGDALWVRLVDLDRALTARRYAAGCDLVFAVTDRFCPWNEGRWRLRAGADGAAEVARTEDEADLACDTTDLASAYLGGIRLSSLAAAGRVRELRPGAVLAASRAMAGDAEPYCLDVF